jgi:DNA polymerase III epsilon subunit-like protein
MKAVIDIETGGFNRKKNAIAEIGVIIIDENRNPIVSKAWLVKPYGKTYELKALEVNSISVEQLEKEGSDFKVIATYLKDLFETYKIEDYIGHNLWSFDIPFLQEFFADAKVPHEFKRAIDTFVIAKKKYNECSLSSLCKRFAIEKTPNHRALSDCFATLELYKKLVLR